MHAGEAVCAAVPGSLPVPVYADAFPLARVNLSNGAYFVRIRTVCSQFGMANYRVMINYDKIVIYK